jgi:predicted porin
MKKLILIALFGLTTLAQAADVYVSDDKLLQIYGTMDAGVASMSNVGKANSRATFFLNSPNKNSLLGIAGTTSIGDGWIGGFKLEQWILPGTATNGVSSATGAANPTWMQNSTVYIAHKSYGKLTLGRQPQVVFDAIKLTDARGTYNFGGSLAYWVDSSAFGGTSTLKTGLRNMTGGILINNVIRYDSPSLYDFTVSAMYAPGGTAGNDDALSTKGITATYKGVKDLTLVAGYIDVNDADGRTTGRTTVVGGNYKFLDDKALVAVSHSAIENPNIDGLAHSEYTLNSISGKYQLTPKFDISGGVYKLDDEINGKNSSRQLSLVGNYALGKQVDVYVGWAQMKNQGDLGLGPLAQGQMNLNSLNSTYSGSSVTVPGQTHDVFMSGLSVRF